MNQEYEEYQIEEASIQFLKSDGSSEEAEPFGCVGTLVIDPEKQKIVKNCGIEQLKSVTKVSYLNVKISAHLQKNVARELFGLSNEGLKEGVYALGKDVVSKDFIFAGVVYNLDRTDKKYIALPKVTNVSGFVKNIDNGQTELAYIELEFNALYDRYNKCYYDAYDSEITDESVKTQWLEHFTPDLVQKLPQG